MIRIPANIKFFPFFYYDRLLYDHIVLNLNQVLDTNEQGTILALECFKELCCLMCTCFSSELSCFLDIVVRKCLIY